MGGRRYDPLEVLERLDPYGQPYYWLGGSRPEDDDDIDTDVGAVKHGYVSVTPITLDMTNYSFLAQLGDWEVEAHGDRYAPPTADVPGMPAAPGAPDATLAESAPENAQASGPAVGAHGL
jgi:hypothetical protein